MPAVMIKLSWIHICLICCLSCSGGRIVAQSASSLLSIKAKWKGSGECRFIKVIGAEAPILLVPGLENRLHWDILQEPGGTIREMRSGQWVARLGQEELQVFAGPDGSLPWRLVDRRDTFLLQAVPEAPLLTLRLWRQFTRTQPAAQVQIPISDWQQIKPNKAHFRRVGLGTLEDIPELVNLLTSWILVREWNARQGNTPTSQSR